MVALSALLGMLGGVVTASPALARGPKWQIVPAAPFTIDASFCGFAVEVVPTTNEFIKLLKTPDGSVIELLTGSAFASLTNLATGKTITENVSGPGTVTFFPDGSVTTAAKGLNGPVVLAPADAARFGLPIVSVTAGALTTSVAADGTITSVSLQGHVLVDVCAALS
jgi:hypothetical protein